jgi:hypothetical protein
MTMIADISGGGLAVLLISFAGLYLFISAIRWLADDGNKTKRIYPAVKYSVIITVIMTILIGLCLSIANSSSRSDKFDDDTPSYYPDFH